MRGGPASVMGNRYVKRSDARKIQYWDKNIYYGTSMCQYLQTGYFVEIEFTEKVKLLKSIPDTKDNH